MDIEQRLTSEQRREALQRLVAEDTAQIDKLRVDRIAAQRGSVLNIEQIKQTLFATVNTYGMVGITLPRGYKVLGTGDKTPFYLVYKDGNRPSAEQFVTDLMTGFLADLAEVLDKSLRTYTEGAK